MGGDDIRPKAAVACRRLQPFLGFNNHLCPIESARYLIADSEIAPVAFLAIDDQADLVGSQICPIEIIVVIVGDPVQFDSIASFQVSHCAAHRIENVGRIGIRRLIFAGGIGCIEIVISDLAFAGDSTRVIAILVQEEQFPGGCFAVEFGIVVMSKDNAIGATDCADFGFIERTWASLGCSIHTFLFARI